MIIQLVPSHSFQNHSSVHSDSFTKGKNLSAENTDFNFFISVSKKKIRILSFSTFFSKKKKCLEFSVKAKFSGTVKVFHVSCAQIMFVKNAFPETKFLNLFKIRALCDRTVRQWACEPRREHTPRALHA